MDDPRARAAAEAFPRLFAEHASYVWNVLRRFRAREADLEDLTHEVFVVLYRNMQEGNVDFTRPLKSWLGATAFRVACAHGRAASARREVLSDEAGELVPDAAAGPEHAAAAAEDRALVLRALVRLDEDRRAVFILHDIQEEAMPAVAEALGINTNTAYSRLRLARADFEAAVRGLRARPLRAAETDGPGQATRRVS